MERRARPAEILDRLEARIDALPAGHPDRRRLTDLAWGIRRHIGRDTPNLAAVRSTLDKAEAVAEPTDVA